MSNADAPLLILTVLLAATFVVYRSPWRLYQGIRYWWRRRKEHQPLRPNG
jgi:hypothetical protein